MDGPNGTEPDDAESAKPPEPKRKRGIQASRAKLRQALVAAGIKTQAELAERMADLEGLETAPRGLVNKVFRGEPVDPLSVERVARALDVEGWQLYLTADEATPTEQPAEQETPDPPQELAVLQTELAQTAVATGTPTAAPLAPRRSRVWLALACAAALCLLAAGFAWRFTGANTAGSSIGSITLPVRVWVRDLQGDPDGRLKAALANTKRPQIATFILGGPEPAPKPELTLVAKSSSVGRWSYVRLFADGPPGSEPGEFWSGLLSHHAAADDTVNDLLASIQRTASGQPRAPLLNDAAAMDFMQGMKHLDDAPNELNLRRAQGRFESALRRAPQFAAAHAGLCQTLVGQRWIGDEAKQIADAQLVCNKAHQTNADSRLVRVAYAGLLERIGRTADATLMLDEIVTKDPGNLDALLALADSRFESYRKTGDKTFLAKSRAYAQKARQVAPQVWRVHHMSGLIALYGGDTAEALNELGQAVALDANELTLVNLGTLRFCAGDVQQARQHFLAAQEVADDKRLGEEYLGAFEFYLGHFAEAVRYRKQAVDALGPNAPSIHQVWGDLGDAYRRTGQTELAAQAYTHALQILQADAKAGNATTADTIFRAYYRVMTQTLRGTLKNPAERQAFAAELDQGDDIDTDPAASLRAAIAWRALGEPKKSARALAKATKTCTVYRQHPDLQGLPGDFTTQRTSHTRN